MQPYLFPYVGYFQLINAVDKFVIYDDVNFIKRGWIHRNNILVNGQANLFTVPLSKPSQNNLINEIALGNDWQQWVEKFLKTMEQAYKKAPHFTAVYELIQSVFLVDTTQISALATESIKQVSNYLEINTEIVDSSEIYKNAELKSQERILDICLQEKATHYINPTGGRELYSKQLFADNGILLNFIESKKIVYPQFKTEFVPWLSIIDLLMFNDITTIHAFLKEFTLN